VTALERRAVGQVVDAHFVVQPEARPPRELETWTDTRYQLLARVKVATKRGEVREVGGYRPVRGAAGWYSVEVWRLKPAVPAWRRALPWVAGGLAALAGVVAAVGYALSVMFAALASVPIAVWVVGAVLLLAAGGGATTVVVKVIVR
jgi:hypothetical protein